jgi:hypothetical protein
VHHRQVRWATRFGLRWPWHQSFAVASVGEWTLLVIRHFAEQAA